MDARGAYRVLGVPSDPSISHSHPLFLLLRAPNCQRVVAFFSSAVELTCRDVYAALLVLAYAAVNVNCSRTGASIGLTSLCLCFFSLFTRTQSAYHVRRLRSPLALLLLSGPSQPLSAEPTHWRLTISHPSESYTPPPTSRVSTVPLRIAQQTANPQSQSLERSTWCTNSQSIRLGSGLLVTQVQSVDHNFVVDQNWLIPERVDLRRQSSAGERARSASLTQGRSDRILTYSLLSTQYRSCCIGGPVCGFWPARIGRPTPRMRSGGVGSEGVEGVWRGTRLVWRSIASVRLVSCMLAAAE